jgi:dynein intermediate chain 3, axonemal
MADKSEEQSEKSEDISDHGDSASSLNDSNSNEFEVKDVVPRDIPVTPETASEVEYLSYQPTRPLLTLRVSKKRRYFSQLMTKFTGFEPPQIIDITQPKDLNYKKENFKQILEIGLQAGCGIKLIPQVKGKGFQSSYFNTSTKTTFYALDDFIDKHKETIAHIDDVTEVPTIEHVVRNVEVKVEEAIQSNETIDVFHDEFEVLGNEQGEGSGNLANMMNEIMSFSNLEYARNKVVSDIQWEPGKDNVVAASCLEKIDLDERVERSGTHIPGSIVIWAFAEFNTVLYVLKAPLEITCFKYNPYKPNIIVGGTISGQVCIWDTKLSKDKNRLEMVPKEKGVPELLILASSGIFDSHKGPVKALCWLPQYVKIERKNPCVVLNDPQEVSQFATLSEDGLILFWETVFPLEKNPYKNLDFVWQPLLKVQLTRPDTKADIGGTHLYINKTQKDSFFWATSDSGDLMSGDWVAKSHDDSRPDFVKKAYYSDFAFRPTVAMQVSPFFHDIILTVHDFHFNIWKDTCETPIFQSYFSSVYLTCAAFSPTKPAVLLIGKADGRIDTWDFLDQSHKESFSNNVSSQKLTVISFLDNKKSPLIMAIGDNNGSLHIIEFTRQNKENERDREKKSIYEFWCKEEERVAYYNSRFEIRAEEFQENEMKKRMNEMKAH